MAGTVALRLAATTGGTAVPTTRDLHAPGQAATRPGPPLAPRELETLRWLAAGYTHTQIARRMGLSAGTVNTYVKRLRGKLQAANKAQLTLRAYELGHVLNRSGRQVLA